jgi:hypothetical protein
MGGFGVTQTVLREISNADPLPEYPVSSSVRLDSHGFIAWEFRRYMNSEMRWNADHQIKGIWFDLVQLAHEQTPVGTLPMDHTRLARMVVPAVDPVTFKALVERPYGVLHGWHPCECDDGTVRLHHKTVTRVVMEALSRKEMNAARTDGASARKRLERLTVALSGLAPAIAMDPAKVYWIDAHIRDAMDREGNKRRSDVQLHNAIQACFEKSAAGFFQKPKRE